MRDYPDLHVQSASWRSTRPCESGVQRQRLLAQRGQPEKGAHVDRWGRDGREPEPDATCSPNRPRTASTFWSGWAPRATRIWARRSSIAHGWRKTLVSPTYARCIIHAELHDELRAAGFAVSAGQMGENTTTRSRDLLGLPTGTRPHLGATAVVEVTGLRNPCGQLNGLQPGLMVATLGRDERGTLIHKAGIMGIVVASGEVRPRDPVRVELSPAPRQPLEAV